MKTLHICLDADNVEYPQIFPDPKEYDYTVGSTAHHRAQVTQEGDKVTVRQPFGCVSVRELYRITGTVRTDFGPFFRRRGRYFSEDFVSSRTEPAYGRELC